MTAHFHVRRCVLPVVVFATLQMQAGSQRLVFAQPVPQAVLDAHELASTRAEKSRADTYRKQMDIAIKKEPDLGLKQQLEKLRDDTLRAWAPNPDPGVPLPPAPNDAALLAKCRKIFRAKQVEVKQGVVTLTYDFTVANVGGVYANDFVFPLGVEFVPGVGMKIPAKEEVGSKAEFQRVSKVTTRCRHENWEGDWVKIGDNFCARGFFSNGFKAAVTDQRAFIVFVGHVGKGGAPQPSRQIDLAFEDAKSTLGFDTWFPEGAPNRKELATDFVLPPNPGHVRLMGGSGGAWYSGLAVQGELDPAWVQAQP